MNPTEPHCWVVHRELELVVSEDPNYPRRRITDTLFVAMGADDAQAWVESELKLERTKDLWACEVWEDDLTEVLHLQVEHPDGGHVYIHPVPCHPAMRHVEEGEG